MVFDLTPEESLIKETVAKYADRELQPLTEKIDREDKLPDGIWKKLGDMGLLGLTVAEEYGGSGGNLMMEVLAIEELARVSPALSLSYAADLNLCIDSIHRNGTEEQKKKFLPKLVSGEYVGGMGLTEPNFGSDAVGLQTSASREGDYYVLNGTKMFITNAQISDVLLVYAKTDKSKGAHGLSTFLVEKDFPGFSVSKKLEKMGMRGSPTAELVFEDCKVPVANLMGEENKGVRIMMSGLDHERACMTAVPVGVAQGALDLAIKYSKERIQFGRPIASFQLMQAKLADMYTMTQASRVYMYWVTRKLMTGARVSKDAAASLLLAGETSIKVAEQAVQVFGGYGMMLEYPVQRYYRDTKLLTIGAGTSEIRRMIIGRELVKE